MTPATLTIRSRSKLEDALYDQIVAAKLPSPWREFRFCERKWRWDFAWKLPHAWYAVEVQGGGGRGRHGYSYGIENDAEKVSCGVVLGWRVMMVTGKQIKDGRALAWIEEVLK